MLILQCLLGALVVGGATAHAQVVVSPPPPPPPPPPSRYRETFEDLSVKVMGGRIAVKRTYDGVRWLPNHAWTDLELVKPLSASSGSVSSGSVLSSSGSSGGGGGGSSVGGIVMPPAGSGTNGPPPSDVPSHAVGVSAVVRMNNSYKGLGGGMYAFGKRSLLRATATGFRWQDRDGHSAEYDTEGRLRSYRDRNGVTVTLQRDAEHRVAGLSDTLGRQVLWLEYANNQLSAIHDSTNRRVVYEYTGNRMTRFVDARGNAWTYEYTSNGTPRSRTDPEGRKLNLVGCSGWVWAGKDQEGVGASYKCSYDASKKQSYIQAKTAGGLVAEAWYNSEGLGIRQDVNGKTLKTLVIDGRTRTSIDRNGGRTVNVYDEFDNLLSRTHPDGSSVKYVYGPLYSLVIQKTDENGVVTHYEYDPNGNLTRKTEAVGRPEQRVTVYTYDTYGNRTSARRLGDARTQESVYQFAYDDSGNLKTLTSPEGAVTRYAYDVMGNVVSITDPREKVWTYTYDANGQLLMEANPLSTVGVYEYNKVGNKTKETDANGKATTFAYNRQHLLTRVTDAIGKSISYEYNIDGEVTREVDEEGKARSYQYDLGLRLLKSVDGNGNVSSQSFADEGLAQSGGFLHAAKINWPTFEQQYRYDRRNRVTFNTVLVGDDAQTTGFSYDPGGNIVKATDPNGKSRLFEYDAFGNTTKETDPLGHVIQYQHDNHNNVVVIVDPNGGTTRFEYDRQNRLSKEVRPLGQSTRYVYDAADNVVDRIDPKGQRTHYVYDDAGRQIKREYFSTADGTVAVLSVDFSYDAIGKMVAWSDGTFSGTFVYDDLQRKTDETVNYGNFALSDHYGYYGNGEVRSFAGPDGIPYTFTYDGENLLASVQTPTGALTINDSFWTEPKTVTLPGGATQTYAYNGLLNLQSLQVKSPTQTPVLDLNNTYDRVQAVTQRSIGGASANYTYDDATRLATAQSSSGKQDYTLDSMGNRVADASGTWTYNANNQLLSRPGVSYTYDENGNLIRKSQGGVRRHYFYDRENRLIRVEDQDGVVIAQYGYDPFDRRLYKDAGGVRTYFFHSDQGMVAEVDSNGASVRTYGYHPQSSFGTRPLFLRTAADYAYYHLDHLGTPVALTASDGRIVWSADYDAFGRAVVRMAEATSHLRLPGQYWDDETGLHYNDRRYYDPETGRYLTEDPIGIEGGLNLYLYAEANPINFSDPTGECRLLGGAIKGAVSGAVSSIVDQLITKGCVNAISWKDVAQEAAIEGLQEAVTCGRSKPPGRSILPEACDNSFTDDTPIHTRDGLVPIGDVKVGDEVLSYAEWTQEKSYRPVAGVFSHEGVEPVSLLTLANGSKIEATDGHPFHVSGQGWKDAGQLVVGDLLDARDGMPIAVVGIERESRFGRYVNLSIGYGSTFFVGEDGALVHNCPIGGGGGPAKPASGRQVHAAKEALPGRSGALNKAKQDLGILRSQHPDSVRRVPMTDSNGNRILNDAKQPIMTREYTYTRPDGSKVLIQDHSAGHKFGEGGVGDRGPHFNVRPPENPRTGHVPGTQDHYLFEG
ncbi:HNH/endonuclease VII fold putative polymorphic toxin [Cystobacter fuscus]